MDKRTLFLDYARSFIGVPYKWGGYNPISGMDCSGYVSQCLNAFGIVSGHLTARDIYIAVLPSSKVVMDRGALIFFGPSISQINHVGIVVFDGLMLEAGNGSHTLLTKEDADLANAFVRMRPISIRKDKLITLLPNALLA